MQIIMKLRVIHAAEELHNVDIEKRQCKFEDEGSELKIFRYLPTTYVRISIWFIKNLFFNLRNYSAVACAHECVYEHALKVCGYCVPWNQPFLEHLIPKNITAHLCDPYQLHCIYGKAMDDFKFKAEKCQHCIPACGYTNVLEDISFQQVKNGLEGFCDEDDSDR